MPALSSYDYAIIRVVPHVEREEFINVGVILFCRPLRFLAVRVKLNQPRLTTLCPTLDIAAIQAHLELIQNICAGQAQIGPINHLSQAERFHWLVAPRSTTIQISPVHCGLCTDPQTALDNIFEKMVI